MSVEQLVSPSQCSAALGLQMLDVPVCLGKTEGFPLRWHSNGKHRMALRGALHILFERRSEILDVFISLPVEGG